MVVSQSLHKIRLIDFVSGRAGSPPIVFEAIELES